MTIISSYQLKSQPDGSDIVIETSVYRTGDLLKIVH